MLLRRTPIVVACALAALALSAPSAGAATKNLWATVNVCDTPKHPDDVGVAARMPGNGTGQRMYMRFYVQYHDGDRWRFLESGGISPWRYVGSAKYTWAGLGWTFGFDPPPTGVSYTMRGFVRFEWRRGKTKVVKRTHRYTSAGHPGTKGADPKSYSERKCKMRGPDATAQPQPQPQPQPTPPYEDPLQ
jgi:hypothetical protein